MNMHHPDSALPLLESASQQWNFNPGWLVAKGSYPASMMAEEGEWQEVAMPHTYHETAAYQGFKKGLRDLGPYTYRKHFCVPEQSGGGKLLLEFEGIRQRGQFFLNGTLLGRISHGVAPFGFDITPYVKFDGENILHVEIDCGDKEFGTGEEMCWFFPGFNSLYGGICRNVVLHAVPKVHATLPLYTFLQTSGTYVYAEKISTERRSAQIGAEIQIKNDDSEARQVECRAVLVDAEGRRVAEFSAAPREIAAGEKQTFEVSGLVRGLEFWQPGHPYLYDFYTIVRTGEEKPDVRKIVTGFRKIEIRGAELFLNNRILMAHGYTPRSQNEWPAVGNSYPDWLHDYSNGMMVEGHARLVRWEHIMASPQDVRSCDRVGLMQIMPGADRENDSVGREWEMRIEIMRDTIIYCRNNPSIILWEAANNVLCREHTQEMIDLRDRWDPRGDSRRPMGGRSEGPEWVSWMYGVRKETRRLSIDSEFMRDESPRRWWDSYSPPDFHKAGDWRLVDNAGGWNRNQDNMCLMQSIVHEQYYQARPGTGEAVCGGGVQIFFADSDTFTRGCDLFRRSGPVDGMRIPKDAYFCNRTMWSNTSELWTEDQPSIFLPGHWNYPAGTVKPIYVFVSPGVADVQLLVNGRPTAGGKRTNTFLFTFPGVAWEHGVIEAVGFDTDGEAVAGARHETCGEPSALRIKVLAGPDGFRADGSDLVLIETEAIDDAGRRCPHARNVVHYEMQGPAVWRGGIWEEDVPKYANRLELPVLNGVHRVFIRSTLKAGRVVIDARAHGLAPARAEWNSHEIEVRDGLTVAMPATLPPLHLGVAKYGPDLPPPPALPPETFDKEPLGLSATGESIIGLTTAFPSGAEVIPAARDGEQIYLDRPWVFQDLPSWLVDAEYLRVANDDASASAGEGVVFKIGKAGRVFVAYDDGNVQFPIVSSPTPFEKTEDKLIIGGRPHTIYRSALMNGGELNYLGTNSWTEQPPEGLNNYVLFVKTEVGFAQ